MSEVGGRDGEYLLDRWLADAEQLAPAAGRDRWLAEGSLLLRGWSEPHRSYHTTEHLAEVLLALDELRLAAMMDEDEALTARAIGWYHDLAYDPRAEPGSNEHRSATLARDHLHHLGVDQERVDTVERGVLMTRDHHLGEETRHTGALAAMHDADLWILAAPIPRYERYREQVRQEYTHVPDELFRAGRAQILRGFADRDRLYLTEHAHLAWTERARRNLAAELQALSHGV
ncbi:HD domain-containing protein [Ornithinimicrobium sp. Y1694]|uniref:HD domain-containing protein n=1 Tax=Ornithinimicrobium sp. Y1694 TaxID=3418590 RepID=UPI003CF96BB3